MVMDAARTPYKVVQRELCQLLFRASEDKEACFKFYL